MDQSLEPDHIYLPDEQVEVKFPGHEGKIKLVPKDKPKKAAYPGTSGVFNPVRMVINLKLTHADQPHAKILKFAPPIELRVRYTESDYPDSAHPIIRMAYWDEGDKQWILFTKAAHSFNQEPLNKSTGIGWVSVMLKEWGDPPIAVGT